MACRCKCGKRTITLIWALLECLFFTGIINGWIWMQRILKYDHYFIHLCDTTPPEADGLQRLLQSDLGNQLSLEGFPQYETDEQVCFIRKVIKFRKVQAVARVTTTTEAYSKAFDIQTRYNLTDDDYHCSAQDDQLDILISLIYIIRNVLILPFGIFMDSYGTTRTRLVAILMSAVGSLMMLFSSADFPWLVLPALSCLGISGLLVLFTNIQVGNLFGKRRYTVMSSFVGAYFSGGLVLLLMKLTQFVGISIQTSFMFTTIGVVPVLISTIAFLPKSRIPWPLPAEYGKTSKRGKMGTSIFESSTNWKRRMSGGKLRRNPCEILPVMKNPMYIWCIVWVCILNLKSVVFDGNLRQLLIFTHRHNETVAVYTLICAFLALLSLPYSPIIGIIMDRKKRLIQEPKVEQMRNIVHAMAITLILSLGSSLCLVIPVPEMQILCFILHTAENVSFWASMFAFFTHVHFPAEHFGKLIGLVLCSAGLISILQFPIKSLILGPLKGDPFYVHLATLLAIFLTIGHPLNVWYHCKLGVINDLSAPSDTQTAVTMVLVDRTLHLEEEDETSVECYLPPRNISVLKSGLQVTDL